ncbi:hypothetical protein Rsub_04686 [Raphidocelis subcapitata]|uniref:CARDB domain-containing protein n=1 Tax=Raphidocelis subcapitata TaxID=307507 RepID=A0A2V0NZ59_9CHLO|nr:hypothetical protein Rsub_04686 [Raphidocelis subcapitata]|eukprot:GBF91962.1 hypothetical protein Rsub_04686 [Raphidocelis subcapitata]
MPSTLRLGRTALLAALLAASIAPRAAAAEGGGVYAESSSPLGPEPGGLDDYYNSHGLLGAPQSGFPPLWSEFLPPLPGAPLAGVQMRFSLFVRNVNNETTEKTTISVWSNQPSPQACGATGADATVKLPPLGPFEIREVKIKIKAPEAPGKYLLRYFIDSPCTVYTTSNTWSQRTWNYTVASQPDWDLRFVNPGASGRPDYYARTEPGVPVAGGNSFSVKVQVVNSGTAPTPEEGVNVAVFGAVAPGDFFFCNSTGETKFKVPQLAPGKSFEATVEVKTAKAGTNYSYVFAWADPECRYFSRDMTTLLEYQLSQAPMPVLRGAPLRRTSVYSIQPAPKSPNIAGKVGKVVVYWGKFNNDGPWPVLEHGAPCNYTDFAASASFDGVVVEPGETKKVTVPDVPVPSAPGEYFISAQLDALCVNPYSMRNAPLATYNAALVK